jgi:hypothetical protein
LVIVAAVCLNDACWWLRQVLPKWATSRGPSIVVQSLVSLALLVMLAVLAVGLHGVYTARTPLDLPGARRLRLSESQVALFRWLSFNLEARRGTFVSMPGMGSLYLWTGMEPPSGGNAGNWMRLIKPDRQQEAVRAAQKATEVSAVRNLRLASEWLVGRSADQMPLVRYINEDFETCGSFIGFELRRQRGRPGAELIYCLRPTLAVDRTSWEGAITMPALPGVIVQRLQLADGESGTLLGDTASRAGIIELAVLPESQRSDSSPVDLMTNPLELSHGAQFRLRITRPEILPEGVILVVRVIDPHGKIAEIIPMLE